MYKKNENTKLNATGILISSPTDASEADIEKILNTIGKENFALVIENGYYVIQPVYEQNYQVVKDEDDFKADGIDCVRNAYPNKSRDQCIKEGLYNKVPGSKIKYADYLSNNIAQICYDGIINVKYSGIDYTGEPVVILKYNKNTKELYIKVLTGLSVYGVL